MDIEEQFKAEGNSLTVEVTVESDGLTSTQRQTIGIEAGADVSVRITDEE